LGFESCRSNDKYPIRELVVEGQGKTVKKRRQASAVTRSNSLCQI
jgi:hypothetical protein